MTTKIKIKEIVEKYGIENIIILAPARPLRKCLIISYTSSNDETKIVPHIINENRYKVSDEHKITLQPLDEKFSSENYYQSDFNYIVNEYDCIEILIKVKAIN